MVGMRGGIWKDRFSVLSDEQMTRAPKRTASPQVIAQSGGGGIYCSLALCSHD